MFGLHGVPVGNMLAYQLPVAYRNQASLLRPELEPFTGTRDRIPEGDHRVSKDREQRCHECPGYVRDSMGARRNRLWSGKPSGNVVLSCGKCL